MWGGSSFPPHSRAFSSDRQMLNGLYKRSPAIDKIGAQVTKIDYTNSSLVSIAEVGSTITLLMSPTSSPKMKHLA